MKLLLVVTAANILLPLSSFATPEGLITTHYACKNEYASKVPLQVRFTETKHLHFSSDFLTLDVSDVTYAPAGSSTFIPVGGCRTISDRRMDCFPSQDSNIEALHFHQTFGVGYTIKGTPEVQFMKCAEIKE